MAASSVIDLPCSVPSETSDAKENGLKEADETSTTASSTDSAAAAAEADHGNRASSPSSSPESSIGHKLLLKQGWQAGQGLGKDLQGPVDAVKISPPHQDELSAEPPTSGGGSRDERDGEAGNHQDANGNHPTADLLSKTSAVVEREKAKEESLSELKSSFFCELCEKQYFKHSEYDNHVNSYDHAHKQRLKELRQKDSLMKLGGSREKDEKKLEKEMKRISEFADARAEKSPVLASEEHDEGDDESHTADLRTLTDLDVNSEDLCGLSQEQKTFLLELKAALELQQKEPQLDMDSIPLPPPPTTVFFHNESQAPPLPQAMELDSIPIPEPSLDAIPMPDTPAPLPTSLPSGPAPPPHNSASAHALLSKIFRPSASSDEDKEENRQFEAQFVVDGDSAESKKKHHTIIFQNKGGVVSFSMSKKTQSFGGPSVFETARLKPIKLKKKKRKEDTMQSKISEMEEEKRREEEERRLRDGDEDVEVEEPAELYPNSPASKLKPKDFKFVVFMKSQEAKKAEEDAAKRAGLETGVAKEQMLSFVNVKNMGNDKDLSWPSEMVQVSKTEPNLCFSCNPLQFDFTSLFPSKKPSSVGDSVQEGVKKQKHKKHGKGKRHRKKKKRNKTEGVVVNGHEEKMEKKKKDKKKKKSKKNEAGKEEKMPLAEADKVAAAAEEKKKTGAEKEGDSGTEGGDEDDKKNGVAKPKKKRYRKRKADSDSGNEDADKPAKKTKRSHHKTKENSKKKSTKSGDESGEEKPKKVPRKRKKRSKPGVSQGSAEKAEGKKRSAGGDGGSDKKKMKMEKKAVTAAVSIAAQHVLEEEGGRVSDFENKEGLSKTSGGGVHAGRSKWDTSSDSEIETMMRMKETLEASVKISQTAAGNSVGGDVTKVKDEGSASVSSSKREKVRDSERSGAHVTRQHDDRDHSSDYSSSDGRRNSSHYRRSRHSGSESDYSYSSGSYTDSYYTYSSTGSDYSYRSYSRSRSRDHYDSYSSYSDDDYRRSRRSRSYSRYRSRSTSRDRYRHRRSFSRSYSRSYSRSRSRSRSRSYSTRKSHEKDSSRYRREMKSSPDKQFSSVLPKKDPPRKRTDSHHLREPKHFDKDKLVAPVGKLASNKDVKQELLQKIKDKKDDPESASTATKTGTTPQVPSSSDKGLVLPLIGKAPGAPRRKNPLEGDKKEDEEVASCVASIPTPDESAKSIPLPCQEPTPKSPPASAATTPSTDPKSASFIGPTLPTNHPLAHVQDIDEESKLSEQDRFQPIGPNDPLVFKAKSSSGDPVVVIPPEQEEMYKKLQEQAQKHAEQRRREEEGILSSDSDDDDKTGETPDAEAGLSEEVDDELIVARDLSSVELQLQGVPTLMPGTTPQLIALQRPTLLSASPQPAQAAIPMGAQFFGGHQMAAVSMPGMMPQPTMLGAPMFVTSNHQPQLVHQPQFQQMFAAPSHPMLTTSSPLFQPAFQPQGLAGGLTLQHLQLRNAYPAAAAAAAAAAVQPGLVHAGGLQLASAPQQPMFIRQMAMPGLSQEFLLGQPGVRFLRPGQPF